METWFRDVVNTEPSLVFQATEDCKVMVLVPKYKPGIAKIGNPLVFVTPGGDRPRESYSGLPMPFDTPYPVYLKAGEGLWASSSGEAMIGATIFPGGF